MANKNIKEIKRQKARYRIRKKVKGTTTNPRLSVRKTNTAVYAQLVDDIQGHTLIALDTRKQQKKNIESVEKMGQKLVKKIIDKKIDQICYDRSGYILHGKVRKLFETVQQGLKKKP